MNPGDIAPMVVMLTLILTLGGVAILRPISKQLAEFLKIMTQERLSGQSKPSPQVGEVREALLTLENRLSQLEERQGFIEALLEPGDRPGSVERGRAAGPTPLRSPGRDG